jgi:phytoene desaturase
MPDNGQRVAKGEEVKRAAVIGAGMGGLALAIRLQSAGVDTTIIEARDKPGGCAYFWERDGFVFDGGPTMITAPEAFRSLWRISGHDMAEDVTLLPVTPFYRLSWLDGTQLDYSNDDVALGAEIARLDPEDVDGYHRFLAYSEAAYREGYEKLGAVVMQDAGQMLRAAPSLARTRAWRSVYSIVSRYVKSDKLRQALSFGTLLAGGNPMRTSALYALIHKLERDGGIWFPKGGANRLVAGMVRHFERLGGVVRLGDPVVAIDTLGDRVTGVRTEAGFALEVDAVASNADVVHSYRTLLKTSRSAQRTATRLEHKRFSPSAFLVHFGVRGTFPDIPHHSMLFGPRYEGLIEDIYDHGVLSEDTAIYLHHPSATDPSVAPEGHSTFYALAPVPNLSKFPADWTQVGPVLEERILSEIARRLIPDLKDRIVTKFSYAPPDFARDLHAYQGACFSLEPTLPQSGWFRVRNCDRAISNLFFVGAGTHPGAGIPGVVAGARATAALMLGEVR